MRRGWLEAAVLLTAIVLVFFGCANKWITSGKIAMNGKDYDKAIEDFNKALDQNPESGEAHYYLAECYKEKGEYRKMLPHLDAAEKLYPKKADKIGDLRKETWNVLFDSGKQNAKDKKWEDAKSDFEMAVKVFPERFETFTNLGYVWQHLGDNDSAYYYYSIAYEMAPDEIAVLENFANLCFSIGRNDKAKELYQKLLEKDPNDAEAMEMLGQIYDMEGDFQEAVNYYGRALDIASDNCYIWLNLGIIYFRQFQDTLNTNTTYSDSAINAYSRALELCPDDSNAFNNLAVAYIASKKYDEAVDILSTYVEDHPDFCKAWDLYSRALLLKGLKSQALEAYKKYEECTGK